MKAAVTASFSKTDLTVFGQLKESIDLIERQIEECQKELTALCKEHFPKQYERIQTIPGVKERAATAIIAETGVDMKMFATAACLVGWCGLKPRNDVSNGMGRIKNPELFLLQLQLCTDNRQEKEQNENPSGNRPENTRRTMAYALQGGGLH